MVSKKISRTLSIVLVTCLLLSGAALGFYFGLSYVVSQNTRYDNLQEEYELAKLNKTDVLDKNAPGNVVLVLPRGANTQKIAEILQTNKIIDNTFAFVLLSKFNGFDDTYIAGTHTVNKSMSYDEIMYALSQGPETVKVTIPPGLTYKEVKAELVKKGVYFDEAVLDGMVNNPQLFLDYAFVTKIVASPDREWLLQGYLFPDTYVFDINADEETIIRTFLNNTEAKLTDKLYAQAAKIGITMDEAVIRASIIQIESGEKPEEMRDVSAVFNNRLKRTVSRPSEWWALESCATVNYLKKEAGLPIVLWSSVDDSGFENSPYNTYRFEGLPPGPICSVGEDALCAALWPASSNYLYFCASGKGDGSNIFASTYAQHTKNVAAARRAEARRAAAAGN